MKNLKNLGKTLSKAEQKMISGGCPRCGHDLDPGSGGSGGGGTGGGGTGGGGNTCGDLIPNCSPGKCFNPSTCRCQYGQGAGPNMNGECL